MIDRILNEILGPVHYGTAPQVRITRQQFIVAGVAYGAICMAIGVLVASAFIIPVS